MNHSDRDPPTGWAGAPDPERAVPDDPFGTGALRERVLAAWAASPARFREDANAEEDYALGGYRDRLVVELAQNAADAAASGGVPGRLVLTLHPDPDAPAGWTLTAANTGAPLDVAGVQALSTLRATAKRDGGAGTVGRFGVGFAAVLDVTDDPVIRSTTGGVRWSRSQTRRAVGDVPALHGELTARDGGVPVLRLPWPDPQPPPVGCDTAVVLPLRDQAAVSRVRQGLADVDAALLLMLPALSEVSVHDSAGGPARVVRASDLMVRTAQRSGSIEPALLADRPVEEQRTRTWTVRWAAPRPAGAAAVLHAPTPTDEPVDLPALLIASFPLEPGRRRVAPGPLADALVEHCAETYIDLVRPGGDPDQVLSFVPGPVAAGALDASLRAAILTRFRLAPVLAGGIAATEAVAAPDLPHEAVGLVAEAIPGLLPAAWSGRPELDRLGVRRMGLAEVLDELAGLHRPAPWWRSLYTALDAASSADPHTLAGLPVPLADGRLVRGPRGVVVDVAPELGTALSVLGVRVAEPDAVSPLLVRAGAVRADPAALLVHPAVRAAVEASLDEEDPAPVAQAALALVQSAGAATSPPPWLGLLALPAEDGGWEPAGELLLPGGPLAALLQPEALGTVRSDWVDRWGPDVLTRTGVLSTFALVSDRDVPLDPDACDHDLDGEDEWVRATVTRLPSQPESGRQLPPVLPEYRAVRDLDLVGADQWEPALRALAADPVLRAAVTEPARALTADGAPVVIEPYTAWWLRTHPVLGGARPDRRALPSAPGLTGLLPPAPRTGLDDEFLRAIGVVSTVAEVADEPMVLPLLRAGQPPHPGASPDSSGVAHPVPAAALTALGDVAGLPSTFREHEDLTVGGVPVDWWVTADGELHAATGDGLARALAWAAGRWERRWVVAAALAEPGRVAELLSEEAWDPQW